MKKSALIRLAGMVGLVCMAMPLPAQMTDEARAKLPPSTPLTRAIRLERFEEAAKLATGEWVNKPDRGGYHPLTYAAYTCNNGLMETLLKAGADPDKVEFNGKTALYVTANLANLEGLELLHRHKTKLPPAPALSPAQAAVLSSSLQCLQRLMALYPEADLTRGWECLAADGTPVDLAGDAVAYAAYHGYDDIARFLLGKGARPTGKDYLGQNALHHAAINPQCSPELVKALLEAGCSGVQKANLPETLVEAEELNLIPRTPVDLAVVSGNFEKVKLISMRLDPRQSASEIRNAAHIAAAYNHEMAARHLLGLINEKLTGYREFFGEGRGSNLPGNASPAMGDAELSRIMPRVRPRPGEIPQAGSIAVISSPDLRNAADLLVAELSKREGILVVERNQIDAIAAERGLRGLDDGDSTSLHNSLDVIPARHLVVMSREIVGEKFYARVAVIDSASGLVLAIHALPAKMVTNGKAVSDLATAVLLPVVRSGMVGIGVSITPVAPENTDIPTRASAADVNALLPHFCGNTKGVAMLSRDQLQYLRTEKAIGVEGSYWAAAWVLDGGLRAMEDGKVELSLRAINAVSKKEVKATTVLPVDNVNEGLAKCWNDLVGQLTIGAGKSGETAVLDKEALEKEAQVLQQHAKWFYDAGHYPEAGKLMEASVEMGPGNRDRIKLALMIQMVKTQAINEPIRSYDYFQHTGARNYSQYLPRPGYLGEHFKFYRMSARAASHEVRLKLLDEHDEYSRLAELTEATLLASPQRENVYGWASSYHRDIEGTLYPFVSNSLGLLLCYANVLDHSMVLMDPQDQWKARLAKQWIESLTTRYLEHLEKIKPSDFKGWGFRIRYRTIKYLLSCDEDFYGRNLPDLFDRMMALSGENLDSAEIGQQHGLDQSHKMAAIRSLGCKEMGLAKASQAWLMLQRTLENEAFKQGVVLSSPLAVYHENSRSARLECLKRQCNSQIGFSLTFTDGSRLARHAITRLAAIDEPWAANISAVAAGGGLLSDLDELKGKMEHLRLVALYRGIEDLMVIPEPELGRVLKEHPDFPDNSQNSDNSPKWGPEVWRTVYGVFSRSRKLGKELDDLFSVLAGQDKTPGLITSELKLDVADMVMMPQQAGQGHRAFRGYYERASIHGDELWLPGIYIQERGKVYGAGADCDNAIQVVNLRDRSIRTIVLPHISFENDYFGRVLGSSNHRGMCGRILVSGDYAYYAPQTTNAFCIHRDNHQVTEIKMPDGYQGIQIELRAVHEATGLMVGTAMEFNDDDGLYQVFLARGDRIEQILTSNRRKPAVSPLDRPNMWPDLLEFQADAVWVASESTFAAHAYDIKTNQWSKLTNQHAFEMKWRRNHGRDADYSSFSSDQSGVDFVEFAGGYKLHLCGYNSTDIGWHAHRYLIDDIFTLQTTGLVKVSMPPVDHPAFKAKWFPRPEEHGGNNEGATLLWPDDPYRQKLKGWWCSANDAIQLGLTRAVIMGKWNDRYLLGLQCANAQENGEPMQMPFEEVSTQAIWLVPEADFEAVQVPLKERYGRYVSFTSGIENTRMNNSVALVDAGDKTNSQWTIYRPLELFGGGAVLKIDPVIKVEKMEFALKLDCKTSGKPVDFTIESGDPANPTQLFDSKQHESWRNPSGSPEILRLPLPDGVEKIRITNHSEKGQSLLLHEFAFIKEE